MYEHSTKDSWEWRFTMSESGPDIYESPGIEVPAVWVEALAAVARDLRCLRYGRDVRVDRLMWRLSINSDYVVTIGWQGAGIGKFSHCNGLSMDAPFGEVAVWVADTLQEELAGNEFIQWPLRGQYMLVARLQEEGPIWVDPLTGLTVTIGELCDHPA